VVLAAVAVIVPALKHGGSLGPYDILGQYGITTQPGAVHDGVLIDQINQMIPWSVLSWTQVHHGQLPLWNPYSALGMPLAFNWQSSSFSVPALISYALPLRYVYTSQVIATLVFAGTGAYALGRVLRVRILACVFLGVAFELSGPFFAWLGWPIAAVASWTGWILAGLILVMRGRHRVRYVMFTGIAVACSVYAGQPDALILLGGACVLFVIVELTVFARREKRLDACIRPGVDVGAAGLLGILLSAPLLFPGFQLLSDSVRSAGNAGVLNAGHALDPTQLLNQYALSLVSFPNIFDFHYAGVAAVVMAVGAVAVARKREHLLPLAAVAIVSLLVAYINPIIVFLNSLPGLHAVRIPRVNLFLAFTTAALAAVGLDVLTRTKRPAALRIFSGLFVAAGVALIVVWGSGYGRVIGFAVLTKASYLWVAGGITVGLAVTGSGLVALRPKWGRADSRFWRTGSAVVMVLFETAFLVVAGANVWSAVPDGTPSFPAATHLERVVGSNLVGFGATRCLLSTKQLGIPPNANILFGVHELAVYDPLLPQRYLTSWTAVTGQIAGFPASSHYCPAVTSVSLARLYGVAYVLELPGRPGPIGTKRVATIAGEGVYRVPGVARATETPVVKGSPLPPIGAAGTAVPVREVDPATWEIHTQGGTAQVLRLRLTDVPGWRATIDGRPLALEPFAGIMLQAVVPAGRHVVTVSYWPPRFTLGLVLAAIGVVAAIGAALWSRRRRRTPRAPASAL